MATSTQRQPSVLQKRANDVHKCIQHLERFGFEVSSISIDENQASVLIKPPSAKRKIVAQDCGIVSCPSGRFRVMQQKVLNVYVRWLNPVFVCDVPQPRAH